MTARSGRPINVAVERWAIEFIDELRDELRVRHRGAAPTLHDGPGPLERLDTAYAFQAP